MQKLAVDSKEQGQRLDRFLIRYFDAVSAAFVYKHLRKKNITLNGKKASGSERLKAGDEISLFFADASLSSLSTHAGKNNTDAQPARDMAVPGKADLSRYCGIIYEDEFVIIADKRAGVLSQKASSSDISLNEVLLSYVMGAKAVMEKKSGSIPGPSGFESYTPSICNRLDKNTSGLLIFAKTYAAAREINRAVRERAIRKYYLAAVYGRLEGSGYLKGWLKKDSALNRVCVYDYPAKGAYPAEMSYQAERSLRLADVMGHKGKSPGKSYSSQEDADEITIVRAELLTGRPHQIRAQLAHAGHPLLGDMKYGDPKKALALKKACGIDSQLLHSVEMVMPEDLPEPLCHLSGRHFYAPLPEAMDKLISCCGRV